MRCPKCNHKLAKGAKFCHQCGVELPRELAEKTAEWYYDPIFVLLSIFLFLSVFGLPLLWKSPRFETWQKAVVSILTVLYTALILCLTYYIVVTFILPQYRELKEVLESVS